MKLKSVDVGGVVIKNNIASAPMAGFSDAAFRTLCVKLGAGLCVTEMVSAKGLIYKNEHTQDLLVLNSSENNGGCYERSTFRKRPRDYARRVRKRSACSV